MICEHCGNEMPPHPYGMPKKYCTPRCAKKAEQKRYRLARKKKPQIRWDLPKKEQPKEIVKPDKADHPKKELQSIEEARARQAEHCRKMREGKSYVGERAEREKNDPYYKIKESARAKLRRAVKLGRMKKPDKCQRCGSDKQIESHHFRGYDHPFDVIWLCHKCHGFVHRKPSSAGKGELK